MRSEWGKGHFTSSATPPIPENTTAVLTVVATDADQPSQTVTYNITGGSDQGKFSITSGGVLTFNNAPDFENPTDANTDNIYQQFPAGDFHCTGRWFSPSFS